MHLRPSSTTATDRDNAASHFEINLVISAIHQYCGQDFSGYSLKSIQRLLENILHDEKLTHLSELIPKIVHQEKFQRSIIDRLTVSYSQLFRDPDLFLQLKKHILPLFSSYPRISLWVAGCATGEEAYSLAILLEEAGLLEHSQIYASDISAKALAAAASGTLKFNLTELDEQRYLASGGSKSLADYFSSTPDPVLNKRLLSRIIFERHDLANQASFISAQLVLCRNVFIYFDRDLQDKVLALLLNSMTSRGYLAVGIEESIAFCGNIEKLELVSRKAGLYQKRSLRSL